MKKLFFSAVALVAFSSVSMANTIDVEKESKGDACQEWAIGFMEFYDYDDDITIVEYNRVYQEMLIFCYRNMQN